MVVSHQVFDIEGLALQARLLELERENARLRASLWLKESVKELFGWRPDHQRLPGGEGKQRLLDAIDIAREYLGLAECLDAVGLTAARYHDWRRRESDCQLEDYSSCPKSHPTQLTSTEVATIGEMARDPALAHMPLGTLARYAMRVGRVFASATSWSRVLKERGWLRPRKRIYPEKPKVGIRATRPNEVWHVDVTPVKLADGSRAYIQAVIDNFSRYVLAWHVSTAIGGSGTRSLLVSALKRVAEMGQPGMIRLLCDSGVENLNHAVDSLLDSGRLVREIAQLEIDYSNSMIERFFLSLKHNHLYLHQLSSLESLRTQTAFYVEQQGQGVVSRLFRTFGSSGFRIGSCD